MFGFIRPFKPELRVREVERFQAVYCGLCHELKRRYGRLQTYFLSYDMAFFSLVIDAVCEKDFGTQRCRCDASPFRKKNVCCSSPSLAYAADISVLLTYHKIADSIADEHGMKRLVARILHRLLRRDYQKASQSLPALNQTMCDCLSELRVIEQAQTASLDRPADTFARLLAAAVPDSYPSDIKRVLSQMFYHVGRWVYLLDACTDLEEDFQNGSYNPVKLRYSLQTPSLAPIRQPLECTLERSLLDIHTACQLLTLYRDQGLIENIIDLGLPIITRQVLDGTYHANGGHETHGSL